MSDEREHAKVLSEPKDYTMWEIRTRAALMGDKVWTIVDGSEPQSSGAVTLPPGMTPTAGPYAPVYAPDPTRTWIARDQKAQSIIMARVSDSILLSISDCSNSTAMWNRIRDMHISVNVSQLIYEATSEIHSLRWDAPGKR
ncbi:hypothetical protein EXIGLDRAFT_778504 [Exidia glandulosa HHB12029]|uniref:DUF4219 domain-containing protein n=1 Tax=Exidia glandulosa HHB12029 TaxID=1314781 RepID=A0A165CHT6_EXIGL|nr:hypothetical protein EXIGLDRAFT_778504 [Exidia glandulosa HHB12029]